MSREHYLLIVMQGLLKLLKDSSDPLVKEARALVEQWRID